MKLYNRYSSFFYFRVKCFPLYRQTKRDVSFYEIIETFSFIYFRIVKMRYICGRNILLVFLVLKFNSFEKNEKSSRNMINIYFFIPLYSGDIVLIISKMDSKVFEYEYVYR